MSKPGAKKRAEYKYETHLHTSETSVCGATPGADHVAHFKKLGYAGIFVTDHFLQAGQTAGAENLPWDERVNLFCRGYEAAAQKGRELGIDVFFGWEYGQGWAHFLTYGLDKEWLLANPDLPCLDLLRYFDRVREAGGIIVHAHPFREGVDLVQLVPGRMDGVEVLNAGRREEFNRHALDYAVSFGLPQTAGSDIHSLGSKRRCGMIFPRRVKDGQDFIALVKSGKARLFDEYLP